MEEKKKLHISRWLDKIDEKAEHKNKLTKLIWQFIKFCGVSIIITLIQIILVNALYYLMKGWTTPLPGILNTIFSEETMGENRSNWGYILPFFLSNLIANSVGYFLNRHRTFKSDAPIWHYILYIVILILLILFSTWFQGLVANWFINLGLEILAPTIGMSVAGFVQFLILFPLQKFVLLREKKKEENIENNTQTNELE